MARKATLKERYPNLFPIARDSEANTKLSSEERLKRVERKGQGFSLEKHLESLCTTEGGFLFVVCGIRAEFDSLERKQCSKL